MQIGGIVLCGGKSSRMGLPKATLPFGPEHMLLRVVRLLLEVVEPVVVIGAPDQDLPALPGNVLLAHDRREGRGPLEGLHAGLSTLQPHAEAAFAVGCDVPLLMPSLVERMMDLLDHHEIAVPIDGKFHHPLAAIYRTCVLPHISQLLAEDRLRPVFLYDQVDTRRVPVDELRDVDPELQSLTNLNRPEDYLTALERAGFAPEEDVLRRLEQ